MSLDKAREEFEQFEKRAALAEKLIKELTKRIEKLERTPPSKPAPASTHGPRAPAARPAAAQPGGSVIVRFPKSDPALVSLVAAQFVGDKAAHIKFTPKPDQEGTELAFYPKGFVLAAFWRFLYLIPRLEQALASR